MISSTEIAKSSRTLICFLQAFIGQRVRLELRNDTYIWGILQSVDSYMNTELSDARLWSIYSRLESSSLIQNYSNVDNDNLKEEEELVFEMKTDDDNETEEWILSQPKIDYIFVKGSRIRYFHPPSDSGDIIESIERQIGKIRGRRSAGQPTKPFNWKSYRKKQKLEKMEQSQDSQPSTSQGPAGT